MRSLLIIFLLIINIYANETNNSSSSVDNTKAQIEVLKNKIQAINDDIKDNIWIKRYENYLTYRKIEKELTKIKKDAKKYSKYRSSKYKEISYQLNNKVKIKENELELISEYKDSPIGSQIKPQPIDKAPKEIMQGISDYPLGILSLPPIILEDVINKIDMGGYHGGKSVNYR